MDAVRRGVFAAMTIHTSAAKTWTIRKFLACWDLPLIPYTAEVVYALGAALKWRNNRSADIYLP